MAPGYLYALRISVPHFHAEQRRQPSVPPQRLLQEDHVKTVSCVQFSPALDGGELLQTNMSTTTVLESVPRPPLNLTLQNGQKICFHSDTSIGADGVPVIDIKGIYSKDIVERKAVAEQIRGAAHRIGFFYIVNHGIDPKYARNTFEQARRFFGQPEEQKMDVCTDLVTQYFKYFPMARVRAPCIAHMLRSTLRSSTVQ